MATPNVGILTNAGKNLIDQVNAGQTKITFSKIVFSSMDNSQLTDDQIKALTAITPQEIVVNNPEVTLDKNTGETRIRATGNNEALSDGVYVKAYAVYAKDDSGNEILYGLTVSPNPNYLPEYDGVTPQAVTYSYKVNISNTSNITFTNSNDVYVSDTDLAEALQPYAKTVDVNQQLDKKVNVSDMRKPASDVAGIEEVSTLQTQVDNSAVGTNLLLGTGNNSSIPGTNTVNETFYYYSLANGYNISSLASKFGTQFTISFDWSVSGSSPSGVFSWQWNDVPWGTNVPQITVSSSNTSGHVSSTFSASADSKNVANMVGFRLDNFVGTVTVSNVKLEKGSVATDWCPNPDDKVNVADMRKPASDVAGIDETVIDNRDNTITANGTVYNLTNSGLTNIPYVDETGDFNKLPHGKEFVNASALNSPNKSGETYAWIVETTYSTLWGGRTTQIAFADSKPITRFRILNSETWSDWITVADDSKVAHLSGANNFDTVPTVNNNPLLLASSLPSDLARTGSDQEFTGKNTFDTAPIDKATGKPYITKDGVPSDVARTGQSQTFTAAQTFSIAPVINDASTDKGDNQAATMADLKSVEKSAWRVLDQSNAPSNISFREQVLYKIDDTNKIIYFTTNGALNEGGSNMNLINFEGIVNNLLSGHGRLASVFGKIYLYDSDISVSSTYVKNSNDLTSGNLISYGDPGQNYAYVIYDSLVNN